MNKKGKIILIGLGIILGIVMIDSGQALIFDQMPILRIKREGMIDKGILVDTYNCGNGKYDTVIKGFSYSCSYDGGYIIIDTTKEKKNFACAEALEQIYEDDEYEYYLVCLKSKYIEVRYDELETENIREALKNGRVQIQNLDKFGIEYIKYEK